MRRVLAFILAVAAQPSPAMAQQGVPIVVEVGASAQRGVGNAIGWFCDDPALINATLVTRDNRNYWVVTGLAQGSTECRVGTDPSRHSVVFAVTVKPAPATPRL
jgi:hypothetical protein